MKIQDENGVVLTIVDSSKADPKVKEMIRAASAKLRELRSSLLAIRATLIADVEINRESLESEAFERLVCTATDPELIRAASELFTLARGEASRAGGIVEVISIGAANVVKMASTEACLQYVAHVNEALEHGRLDAEKDCPCNDCVKQRTITEATADA